jgi:hypothetical protein
MFGDVCCDTESLEWQFCSVSPSMCFRASKMVGGPFPRSPCGVSGWFGPHVRGEVVGSLPTSLFLDCPMELTTRENET